MSFVRFGIYDERTRCIQYAEVNLNHDSVQMEDNQNEVGLLM